MVTSGGWLTDCQMTVAISAWGGRRWKVNIIRDQESVAIRIALMSFICPVI